MYVAEGHEPWGFEPAATEAETEHLGYSEHSEDQQDHEDLSQDDKVDEEKEKEKEELLIAAVTDLPSRSDVRLDDVLGRNEPDGAAGAVGVDGARTDAASVVKEDTQDNADIDGKR